jgi:uncharacterized protein YkwD
MQRHSNLPVKTALLLAGMLLTSLAGAQSALPVRSDELDGLAESISGTRRIPRGGDLLLLAAANGWYGPVSDVIIHPSTNWQELFDLYETGDDVGRIGVFVDVEHDVTVIVTAAVQRVAPYGLSESYSPGDTVSLTFPQWSTLGAPLLAIETPDMQVLEIYPDSGGTCSFVAVIRGVYWIEVLEEASNGPEVALLFPLVAGGTEWDVLEGRIDYPRSGASSMQQVLDELNGLRESMGILPLEENPLLDSIAQIRAADLAISGSTSHHSEDGNSLAELLPQDCMYAENIGRGTGFDEAWSMLLLSPLHLRTCLSPDYQLIGTGASVDVRHDKWQLVIVQVFTTNGNDL